MKKKFLLHTCCAPCSIAVIDELSKIYDLTVFFYNPNIYPEEEYLKRKREVIKICQEWQVPMVDMDYDTTEWRVITKGLEKEPEGGKRCLSCISLRLAKTANYASQNGFNLFSSTLTSGRNKKAEIICPLGEKIGQALQIEFVSEDWKKKGRQEKAKKMVEERGIYRQNYCGCIFSLENSKNRIINKDLKK